MQIRWNIFIGIMMSAVGMYMLNYYTLFPEANNTSNDDNSNDDGKKKLANN